MTTNRKLAGEAKRQARIEAAYQNKMQARYGLNSIEYAQIANKKGWK